MRWRGFRKVRRQVSKRIRQRAAQLGLADLGLYKKYLEQHPAEWRLLDGFCRISISRFYRDRDVFDFLRDVILPQQARKALALGDDKVRCWSAGCASGEEPYTLAILWKCCIEPRYPGVVLEITATDVDDQMLQRAGIGEYGSSSLKDLPPPLISRAFTKSDEEFHLKAEFREHVHFQKQDIRHELPDRTFSLILCRHLAFTYYDECQQRDVLQRLCSCLDREGIFVIAKKETLPQDELLSVVEPRLGVYRWTKCSSRQAARHAISMHDS